MTLKQFLFGTINRKIILGFLVIVLIIAITGFSSLFQVRGITNTIIEEIPLSIEQLEKTSNLDALARFIQYYDEVLTMSARNYAFTSDIRWKTRYYDYVPLLDAAISESIEKGDEEEVNFFESVDIANIALIKMEEEAIENVDNGNYGEAIAILESKEYWRQKEIYKTGLINYVETRGENYEAALSISTEELSKISIDSQNTIKRVSYFILIAILLTLAVAFFVGFYVSRKISKPIKELSFAANEIERGNFKSRIDIKTGDELERLGKTLNKTIEVLEKTDEERKQLDKAKTEFMSITSHELRSPMTPMKAQLQMILGDYFGKISPKQRESLDIVLRNTERLDRIIQDFLEISRIEAARLKFKFIRTDIGNHVQRLVKEMQGFMPEKKIRIVANIGKIPVIEVDPDRIMQILRNLINNAIKFTPEDGKIIINVGLESNMIKFSVQDNGVGVKKEDQRRLFEPFFQAEQTMYREKGGTGLGLAICKGIVETQEGKIWIESELGKGSTFLFKIPLKPVKEIKSIKLLFSTKKEVDKKVKEVLINILGPLGIKEFERLEIQGLDYKSIIKCLKDLEEKRVIDKAALKNADHKLTSIFEIKIKKLK